MVKIVITGSNGLLGQSLLKLLLNEKNAYQVIGFSKGYHHHTSIELNFLQGCEMEYSFSGQKTKLTSDRLTVFWGAAPHKVSDVVGVKNWLLS